VRRPRGAFKYEKARVVACMFKKEDLNFTPKNVKITLRFKANAGNAVDFRTLQSLT
jgi:hypothetical protein